jgi:hypothetical protein
MILNSELSAMTLDGFAISRASSRRSQPWLMLALQRELARENGESEVEFDARGFFDSDWEDESWLMADGGGGAVVEEPGQWLE